DKGSLENYPNSLPLALQHATRENSDITVMLDHGIGNQYIGHVSQSISEGIWYFEIADKSRADADWKLNARHHVRKKNTIHLKSSE
ncbi:MAG: FixH family protein, partial [Gammaproteobacteria bacterium]